jgi:ParB family chromosome partitioning protein
MIRSDSRKALGKGLHSLLPPRPAQNIAQNAPRPPEAAAPVEPPGERILKIPIGRVYPNRNQPRADFDEAALLELTASVGRDGILQPIVARRNGAEAFEIIAGERRWRAAKAAGLTEVPIILREADENRALELALIENIQREDLNPMELARAFERMVQLGLRHDEIGEKTGKDRTTVTNALRLLQLPDFIQSLVGMRKLSPGHARALLKLNDADRFEVAERCIREGWSVRQIEEFTKNPANGTAPKTAIPPAQEQPARTDPNVRAVEAELQEMYGTKVRIVSKGRGRGQIEIEYYSDEDLQRLYELMAAQRS